MEKRKGRLSFLQIAAKRLAQEIFFGHVIQGIVRQLKGHPKEGEKTLKGFMALVKVEDPESGQILPHEWTFPSAKEDRLRLIRACRMNTSPIFTLYSDPDNRVMEQLEKTAEKDHPIYNYLAEDGIRHRLWAVFDSQAQQQVAEHLKDRPLFIADGHHRYETALNYRNEMRSRFKHPSLQPYDSVLMYCASMYDPGMSLFPIHRVILNPLPLGMKEIREKLAKLFDISLLEFTDSNEMEVRKQLFQKMEDLGTHQAVFAMYAQGENRYELLRLKSGPTGTSPVDHLDVTKFQRHVLEQVLGIENTASKKEDRVQFIKDAERALQAVRNGTAGIAFLLNPTRVDQVREVVLSGDRMPQKSTFFCPKPLTGFVMNVFDLT